MTGKEILFCVWLIPAQPQQAQLQTTINELAEQHNAPTFNPHATLFCGKTNNIDNIKSKLKILLENQSTIETKIDGIKTSEAYYKTLYLQLQNTQTLAALNEQLKQHLDPKSHYTFSPHLSLLYKNIPLEKKQAIAKTLQAMPFDTISFNTVAIMSDTEEENSAAVKSWRILSEYKLCL